MTTHAAEDLVHQISDWAEDKAGWSVQEEESSGGYPVPDLIIDTPEGRLVLEVKESGQADAPERVELYAWPTLFRVMLLQKTADSQWTIRTDSGIALRQLWNQDTFFTLAEDLLSAA